MVRERGAKAKSRNFSLAFEKMCNFVAIANTRDADEILRQLILQCFVVLPDEHFENPKLVSQTLDALFGLQIPEHWFQSIFNLLVEEGVIIRFENYYILSTEIRSELQKRIDEAMALEENVKQEWFKELMNKFSPLSHDKAWATLRRYLAGAFRRHGIQTAALLDPDVDAAPEYSESLSELLEDVLKDVVQMEQQPLAKQAVSEFLADVGNHPNRAKYLTQLGDGAFNYFSLIVAPDTSQLFRQKLQPLILFLDTNFLFGVLDLHVNPLVEVSNELLRLVEKYSFPFMLRLHEATQKELRSTINFYRQLLLSRNWSQGLSRAATATRCVSGVVAKYHQMNAERPMDVDTFFRFYEHSDVLLQSKNILVYQPEGQQDITDLVGKYQEFLNKNNKEKPQKIVEHDMTVLYTVRKLRSNAKSSIEAEALLITCDYLLYRFDWETSRREGRLSCVVLPNIFWQVLRPFAPADLDFERSFAETFALPEFRSLSSGSLEACSKLLCLLALYKDIPEETAARLLSNDLLISRLRKIDDDKKFQESVESAIAADNISLIEERAALAKQLQIEKMEREAKDQELREDRIRFQEERDRMQRALSEKEDELKLLRKVESEKREIESAVTAELSGREETTRELDQAKRDRKSAERVKETYATALGIICALILSGSFIYIVNNLPWTWLLNHQNSYGLQGAFCFFISVSVLGIFKPKWGKWLWSGSVLSGLIFVALTLLGGRSR
jgi:hypothetical protein